MQHPFRICFLLTLFILFCTLAPVSIFASEGTVLPSLAEEIVTDDTSVPSIPEKPAAPSELLLSYDASHVTLTWPTVDSDSIEFRIYRSALPTDWSEAELIGSTPHNRFTDASAPTGAPCYYRIYTYDPVTGLTSDTFAENVTYPLNAVQLTVASVKTNQITLKWSPVTGADTYKIYRNGHLIASVSKTSFVDTSLTINTTYMYSVKAENHAYGTYSDSITLKASTTLQTPRISLQSKTYNSLFISWSEIPEVSGYEIYRSKSKSGTYTKIKTTTKTSYTDTKLSCGTTYYYKIKAYKTLDGNKYDSSFSSIKSCKPTLATPASKVKVSSYNSLTVSWEKVPGATSYKIYRSTSKNSGYKLIGSFKNPSSYIDKNLTHGITYYYKIQALYKSAASAFTQVSAAPKCKAPSLTLSQSSYKNLTLSWKPVTGAASYNIYRSTSKDGTYRKIGNVSGTQFTDSGLSQGNIYYYKVCSVRNNKTGDSSRIKSSKLYLAAPSGLSLRATGPSLKNGITLSWKKTVGATSYIIYRSANPNSGFKKIGTSAKNTYVDTKIKSLTTYYYKIKAINGSVASSQTATKSFIWAKTARYQLKSLTVGSGKSWTPELTLSPASATPSSCVYSSSNPKVATVNSKGVIKALSAGTTTITCKPCSSSSAATTIKLTVIDSAITVVLDPGHGGTDPGAVSTFNGITYRERDLNLKIAQYTQKALSAYKGVIVYLTRTSNDQKPDLEVRTEIAKDYLADLFVSQHLNSSPRFSANGAFVYTSVNPRYRMNGLAECILEHLETLGLQSHDIISLGYSYNPSLDYYGVLRHCVERKIPAVLIENAFISNASDVSKALSSSSKLKKIGVANAAAIAEYYDLSKK